MKNKEVTKILKEIEKKIGFDAYKKMLDIYWKQQLKIEELIKSRENCRLKFTKMKGGLKWKKN